MSTLEGFGGPGGMSKALQILGLPTGLGIEINADACATAQAAGHDRLQADIRSLDPADFAGVTGWVSGPPCPTYSDAGKRSGRGDYGIVLNAAETLGRDLLNTGRHRRAYEAVADERSALVLETLRFALELPDVRWIVAEQVPAVGRIWEEFCAELSLADWMCGMVVALRADDFGLPTRRTRVFLVATRDHVPDFFGLPMRALWQTGRFDAPEIVIAPGNLTGLDAAYVPYSMADALGWPPGIRINTRGNRRTPGGNEFSADAPAPSLTGNGGRSWSRTDLGNPAGRLESWQAGLLQGFPPDYPWQGSRTSQFQRIADSVPPPMGAAIIGATLGLPWRERIDAYLDELYAPALIEGAAA